MTTLRDLLEPLAPPHIRQRGESYWRRGAVFIEWKTARTVQALVEAESPYEASLAWDGNRFDLECGCPKFRDTRGPCVHIWATLLAAESTGWSSKNGQPPTSPTWSKSLRDIDKRSQDRGGTSLDWPHGREISYLIDVPSTLESQHLMLFLSRRDRRKDGSLGSARKLRLSLTESEHLPEAADREILALLHGAVPSESRTWVGDESRRSSEYQIPLGLHRSLVQKIAETGRCLLKAQSEATPLALRWEGEPWQFGLEIDAPKGNHYTLKGVLRRKDQQLSLDTPLLLLNSGLVFFSETVAPLDHGNSYPWISELRHEREILIPEEDLEEFFETLALTQELPPLKLPKGKQLKSIKAKETPILYLDLPSDHGRKETLSAELSFDYQGWKIFPDESRQEVLDFPRRQSFGRNLAAEEAHIQTLFNLSMIPSRPGRHDHWNYPSASLASIVRALGAQGWRVEAAGEQVHPMNELRMGISSGIDWFSIQGEADFGSHKVPVATLLNALREGRETLTLPDGSLGLISDQRTGHLEVVAEFSTPGEDGEPRLGRSQVALLDALLADRVTSVDDSFREARANLHGGASPEPRCAPQSFQGELRAYQQEGLGWLVFLEEIGFGGCLADDMGLGKTVQVLALLERRRLEALSKGHPSLVVVPRSLISNWKSEAARFTPELKVHVHLGHQRWEDDSFLQESDLILTTYGTLRRDILRFESLPLDYAVLDEAQAIKNPQTATARSVRLLRTRHRLALSGTPIENHLGELWSLFEFLNPGMLGRLERFQRLAERSLDEESVERDLLVRAIRPFMLRRTKNAVAAELPDRTEQILRCPMQEEQAELYGRLLDQYRQKFLTDTDKRRNKVQVLEALLRLRQTACHPALVEGGSKDQVSGKFEVLLPRLEEVLAEGHKALVFSQFTSLLALLRRELDELGVTYEYLDGKTRKRAERVARFQEDPHCKIFLISLKAGGLGLNLTAADYVFLLDPWWNPAVEAQAIDRAHRIGQDRHVFAYRLISEGTIEERVLELQQKKRDLAASIMAGDNRTLKTIDLDDLEYFFG